MSIATLKKKTHASSPQWSLSRGHLGFALNGTIRPVGVVGQTNLAKSVKRTPFRGTEPMGSGGCCGTYKKIVSNSGSCCASYGTMSDEQVSAYLVKKSTKNNKGMIISANKWMHGAYPYKSGALGWWVQPINSTGGNIVNSAGQQIEKVKVSYFSKACKGKGGKRRGQSGECDVPGCGRYHIGGKLFVRQPYAKNFNLHMRTSEQRLSRLKSCVLAPPLNIPKPFPFMVNNDGSCDINWTTIQGAQADNYNTWGINIPAYTRPGSSTQLPNAAGTPCDFMQTEASVAANCP